MSDPSPSSPPKRPRLSLQIQAISSDPSLRTSRALAAAVDVKDLATFNALSNVYATAIDRSTPTQEKPPQTVLGGRPSLRLQTQDAAKRKLSHLQSPYLGPYLDTPLTAQPASPAVPSSRVEFPSTMTATPPLSAGPTDPSTSSFPFDGKTESEQPKIARESSAKTPRRSSSMPPGLFKAPYTHPCALHSILRNSPLPAVKKQSPISPRRQSLRLQEKAARRVAYNSPLCQTITNRKYTRSHMDLLAGDETPSPFTPSDNVDDAAMSYSSEESRDGDQTPGPFEEMRRRMASMQASSPLSPSGAGIRKRKRKEKKRRWVWTIGEDSEDADPDSPVVPPGSGKAVNEPPRSVPTISLPLPRPRTRQQTALATVTTPGRNSEMPVPPTAKTVPIIAIPAPRPRTRMQSALGGRAVASTVLPALREEGRLAVPAPLLVSTHPAAVVPEPTVAPVIEPPTPSVESTASQDSIFEHAGADVEMSDVSSFSSEIENEQHGDDGFGGDDEMDTDTPTATVKPDLVALVDEKVMLLAVPGIVPVELNQCEIL